MSIPLFLAAPSPLARLFLLIVLTGALSMILTMGLRAYALAHRIMDIPNERSSHEVPTPRGGGAAIVISFSVAILILLAGGDIPARSATALLGAGGIVALVGFIDDHSHIAARWRLLAHFSAAIWVLYWLGSPLLDLPGSPVNLGFVGLVLCTFYLVWMLNLYNFMDGIDGIAGVEAASVAFCGGALSIGFAGPSLNLDSPVVAPALLLAAASLGFLVWNYPPAKIFMGDAGSGFLGIALGTLSLIAGLEAPALFWSWTILLGVFVVDATVVLFRRLVRRQKLYEAHRSHAYQFAARCLGAHKPVTLAVGLINVFWLLPIAWVVALGSLNGLAGIAIAYAPLVALAIYLKAGAAELQSSCRNPMSDKS